MAQLRKTVGVYERPQKRGINPRVAAMALIGAIAVACAAAALVLL